MSDYLEKTFIFKSTDFKLKILSGVVINSDTRSNSYGKEVWIKAVSGKEYRLLFPDYAIRAGHVIHLGYVDDIQQILYNQTIDQFWYLGEPEWAFKAYGWWASFWWLTLLIFLAGCLVVAIIGIPIRDTQILIGGMLAASLFCSLLIKILTYNLVYLSRKKNINRYLAEVFFSTKTKLNEIANQLQSKPPTAITQSESSFCSGCGKPAVPDVVFCSGCGTKLIAA